MDNIIIRKAKKGDGKNWVDFLNTFINNKDFKYQGSGQLRGRKDILLANKSFSSGNKSDFTFFAIDTLNNKIVGNCSARGKEKGKIMHRIDIGWNVHSSYQRKGIATKLVKNLLVEAKKRKIKRVEAEVAIENGPSVKIAKKFGFKIEGKRKNGMLLNNGKYIDTYLFGKILK